MKMISGPKRPGGFTLIELLVAIGVYSLLAAALAAGVVALVRSFTATEKYSKSVADQLRILDYVARDARLASSVAVTMAGRKLTLTLPDQYANAAPDRAFRLPSVSMTSVIYGTTPVTVAYYASGSNFIREENGVREVIATDVADFELSFDHSDPSGKVVATTLTFSPKYQIAISTLARGGTRLTSRATLRQ